MWETAKEIHGENGMIFRNVTFWWSELDSRRHQSRQGIVTQQSGGWLTCLIIQRHQNSVDWNLGSIDLVLEIRHPQSQFYISFTLSGLFPQWSEGHDRQRCRIGCGHQSCSMAWWIACVPYAFGWQKPTYLSIVEWCARDNTWNTADRDTVARWREQRIICD